MDIRIDKNTVVAPRKLEGFDQLNSANNAQFVTPEAIDLAPENRVPVSGESAPAGANSKAESEIDQMAKALIRVLNGEADDVEAGDTISKLNALMHERDRDLEFSVDDITGRNILKVLHSGSGEIIRQFPVEEAIRVARYIKQGIGGLLDDRA